jgi:hypothetical protein
MFLIRRNIYASSFKPFGLLCSCSFASCAFSFGRYLSALGFGALLAKADSAFIEEVAEAFPKAELA